MSDFAYWRQQNEKPLFPQVDTERPEQRRMMGKVLVVGGNKGMFFTVANVMQEAEKLGFQEVHAVMPDSLKNTVPTTPQIFFAEAETSGAFGRNALPELLRQADWADVVLMVGDLGKNAETSIALVEFLTKVEKPVYVMRDAIDVASVDAANWSLRETETVLLATMPQLQKLFRNLYYPKMITLSMPTNQLVETLHKFTLSFELTVATFHNGLLIVADKGEIVTTDLKYTPYEPLTVWSGGLLVKMAAFGWWNPGQPRLNTIATACLK